MPEHGALIQPSNLHYSKVKLFTDPNTVLPDFEGELLWRTGEERLYRAISTIPGAVIPTQSQSATPLIASADPPSDTQKLWFETDTGVLWFWRSGSWLSVQLFSLQIAIANPPPSYGNPFKYDLPIPAIAADSWVESFFLTGGVTNTNANQYWKFQLLSWDFVEESAPYDFGRVPDASSSYTQFYFTGLIAQRITSPIRPKLGLQVKVIPVGSPGDLQPYAAFLSCRLAKRV